MKIGSLPDIAALPAPTPAGSGVGGPAPRAAHEGSVPWRGTSACGRKAPVPSAPGFDAEKVKALRQAIDDGSFRIDARVIADRLIGRARALPGRVPH